MSVYIRKIGRFILGEKPTKLVIDNEVIDFRRRIERYVDGFEVTFQGASWSFIKYLGDMDLAQNFFALGDIKTDVDGNGVEHEYRLVQFMYEGNSMLIEDMNPLHPSSAWNEQSNVDDDGRADDYGISNVRQNVLPEIFLAYPPSLKAVINNTEYKVAKNGASDELITLSDRLFLGAEKEYFGTTEESPLVESSLERFALYATNDTNEFRVKYEGPDSPKSYWLRSPSRVRYPVALMVTYSGVRGWNSTSNIITYVSPLFTVGEYATRTVPYDGDQTLTAEHIAEWASNFDAELRAVCTKVVVPVDFTAYESGSIDAIIAAFPNMAVLTTCYEAGNIDLDMSGEH